MSTNLGPRLPQSLVNLLSGDDLRDKATLAYVLVSQGEDGFPHPSVVSPGEIVAADATMLRMALSAESTASRNLRSRPVATLCLAHEGAAYYVKIEVGVFPASAPAFDGLAVFTLRPKVVLEDREPESEVTSGFLFRDLRGEEWLLARWKPVVAALQATFRER